MKVKRETLQGTVYKDMESKLPLVASSPEAHSWDILPAPSRLLFIFLLATMNIITCAR